MADWVHMTEGVRRRILNDGEKLMLVQVEFAAAGNSVPAHHHINEQISYVTMGKMRFTVDGREVIVSAGESLHVPANVVHDATALEPSTVLDMFSPPRDDFRPKA
jgi:quercetin dioxygenase-like cupin family protein